jgi:hypothetical protein
VLQLALVVALLVFTRTYWSDEGRHGGS